jgi:hypothetical protein
VLHASQVMVVIIALIFVKDVLISLIEVELKGQTSIQPVRSWGLRGILTVISGLSRML